MVRELEGEELMKSIHFCTPKMIDHFLTHSFTTSYRTGFIPDYEDGEIIKVFQILPDKSKVQIGEAKVLTMYPVQIKNIVWTELWEEELCRYKRTFKPTRWFFKIELVRLVD